MSEWDSDIASLLDDVLQDKPEADESPPEQEATPETPTPEVDTVRYPDPLEARDAGVDDIAEAEQALSSRAETPKGDTALADILAESESGDENVGPPEAEESSPAPVETSEASETDVTTVVSEVDDTDVAKAKLPQIEFSTPVEDDDHIPIPTFTNDELMESIDVRNFGTLVSLTNRRWHAKVKDRKAAKDAANATGADAEAFEARKRLLVGADEKLKAVHKHIDAARTDHYRMTLPWSTVGINDIGKRAGSRLLPNSMFFEYAQVMGTHKVAMKDALDKFVQAYPTLIALAQQKLGSSFNQSEYPAPSVIEQHFTLEFDFEPIPTGGDFQGLQDAQVEKLAEALRKKTQKRLENAMQEAWVRLYETVERAVNALTNPDAMFHYTLVDALREHSSMLKHLNVINDAKVEEIRAEVEKELTKHDAKDVRKDDALRKRLGEAASAIKQKMEEYAS